MGGKDLFIFILILAGLWFMWFFTGGPERQTSQDGLFIKQPNEPGEKWYLYNKNNPVLEVFDSKDNKKSEKIREDLEKAQELAGSSYFREKILLKKGYARNNTPDREYLLIEASPYNKEKINITGWILESMITGQRMKIGKATYLPQMYSLNYQESIFLSPGGKAYVNTGRSPIGTSFRTNMCTGYFEQFQDFTPALDKKCPNAEDESDFIIIGPNRFNDDCIDFVESIPRCNIVTKTIPLTMQRECANYIVNEINYKACVEKHKNEDYFYDKEWRIFLNRDYELWKEKREVIRLLDSKGKVVDTITY